MKVKDVSARVDGLGYVVTLENLEKIDILIDQFAIAILAVRAHLNRSKRAVAGPCKATVRKVKR